jgi:hypothetical protein
VSEKEKKQDDRGAERKKNATPEEREFWARVFAERFGRYRDLMNTAPDAIDKARADANAALDGFRERAPWPAGR